MDNIVEVMLAHWGLEVLEEFQLMDENGNILAEKFRFNAWGDLNCYDILQGTGNKTWFNKDSDYIENILSGKLVIVKPFNPECGEDYWYPDHTWEVVSCSVWEYYPAQIAMREYGMIARTKEEMERRLSALKRKYSRG